jgi:predicted DNA binding protein
MASIAQFTLPAAEFVLGNVFRRHPGATIELERVIPTSDGLIPYFWVQHAGDGADITRSFGTHPDLRRLELVDEVNGEYLLRVEWASDYHGVLRAISETGVTLISGSGTIDEWVFGIRASNRAEIVAFRTYCQDHDVPVELTSLYALSQVGTESEYNLTDRQREALVLAYERGYYDSPRETTLAELAGEVDITGQSFGSRLRRGIRRLIGSTLVDPE